MKKDKSLSPEELQQASILLMNPDAATVQVGLAILKTHPQYIENLKHELLLLKWHNYDKKITKIVSGLMKKCEAVDWAVLESDFELFSGFLSYETYFTLTNIKKLQKVLAAFEQKRPIYEPLILLNPNMTDTYVELAEYLHRNYSSKPEIALSFYESALRVYPQTIKYWDSLADFYLKENQPLKEIECLLRILELAPNNHSTRWELGARYVNTHQYENAKHHFQICVDTAVDDEQKSYCWADLGLAYEGLVENEKAVECWNEALRLNPDCERAYDDLACNLWEKQGRMDEAEKVFKEGLRRYPQDSFLAGNYAEMLAFHLGRYAQAKKLYEKSIKNSFDDYFVCHYIYLLIKYLDDKPKAERLYKRLLKSLPANRKLERPADMQEAFWQEMLDLLQPATDK